MEIPEELLRGIYAYGFEKPSAIQQRAIKPTMLGRDLIAQAQSGTVSQPQSLWKGKWLSRGWGRGMMIVELTPSFESEKSHPRRV